MLSLSERTAAKFPQQDNFKSKIGKEIMILRTRGEERKVRKDGDNLHGVIALPTRHLLKERLISQLPFDRIYFCS
jgi:hypothetical protein